MLRVEERENTKGLSPWDYICNVLVMDNYFYGIFGLFAWASSYANMIRKKKAREIFVILRYANQQFYLFIFLLKKITQALHRPEDWREVEKGV